MKSVRFTPLLVFLILFSLSCVFVTQSLLGGSGPKNFTASLSAPDVVALKWDAVEGATAYILELSIDQGESIPIVELPPERTSYEDLSAPGKSNLTYQVQAVTESGSAGKSKVSIETGERQPNPVTVTPVYDEEHAVVTTVGVSGGTVSLVESNKVQYTLVIPQGALSADTEIRMTAVTSIQDWPLDGNAIGAVRLEPEGLVLNDVAILTIGIPVDIDPGLALVGYAFQADGQEFHLQPSYEQKGLTDNLPAASGHLARPLFQASIRVIRTPVIELRVDGVGQATSESVSKYAKDHAPTDAAAALEQKRAAEAVADDALTPLESTRGWKPIPPEKMEGRELANKILKENDCKKITGLMGSLAVYENNLSFHGMSDSQVSEFSQPAWDALADKVKEILENSAAECEKSSQPGSSSPAGGSCAKALLERISNPGSSNFNKALQAKMSFKFKDNELQTIKDKLEKCKPPKAYHISGMFGDVGKVEGNACDATKPFTLDGVINMVFAPTDENSGSFIYAGGPQNAAGSGKYTIANGTLEITGAGQLGPDAGSGSLTFAVTPIDPSSCVP